MATSKPYYLCQKCYGAGEFTDNRGTPDFPHHDLYQCDVCAGTGQVALEVLVAQLMHDQKKRLLEDISDEDLRRQIEEKILNSGI